MIFCIGNGGLYAEALHFTAELTGVFAFPVYIPCITLGANQAELTALANDIGYENTFAHLLNVQAKKGDTLIILTTSKLSKENPHSLNLWKALEIAKKKELFVILYDADNLDGKSTQEKQEDCIKKLHKLAYDLKIEIWDSLHSKEKVL
jgi:phosphoheptose isomerase